uniref:Uncharacterized protein n=1 Tax=Equus caballus TaxID=9796 RepID=A0A3Q2LSK8_HORSE
MLAKSSTRPVALPCASCAWKTNLRAGPGGSGRPPRAPAGSPSTSRALSLDLAFLFRRSPRGILPGRWRGSPALPTAASLARRRGLCAVGSQTLLGHTPWCPHVWAVEGRDLSGSQPSSAFSALYINLKVPP